MEISGFKVTPKKTQSNQKSNLSNSHIGEIKIPYSRGVYSDIFTNFTLKYNLSNVQQIESDGQLWQCLNHNMANNFVNTRYVT